MACFVFVAVNDLMCNPTQLGVFLLCSLWTHFSARQAAGLSVNVFESPVANSSRWKDFEAAAAVAAEESQ